MSDTITITISFLLLVACHLVQNGWKDVVIVDKGGVADGTSKTGSGMLGE